MIYKKKKELKAKIYWDKLVEVYNLNKIMKKKQKKNKNKNITC